MPRKGKRSLAAKRRWKQNRLQLPGSATQCGADDAQQKQQGTFGKDYIISLKTNKITQLSRLSKTRRAKEIMRARRHKALQQLRACSESIKDSNAPATKADHSASPACGESSNSCLSAISDVHSMSNAHCDDTMPVNIAGGKAFAGSPGMASNITQTETSRVTEEAPK